MRSLSPASSIVATPVMSREGSPTTLPWISWASSAAVKALILLRSPCLSCPAPPRRCPARGPRAAAGAAPRRPPPRAAPPLPDRGGIEGVLLELAGRRHHI